MISDLKFLVYSYLTLDEILIIFEKDMQKTNIIISRNYKNLPNIDDELDKGNLKVAEFLCKKQIWPLHHCIAWTGQDETFKITHYSKM